MSVTHPAPVTVEDEYDADFTTARPDIEDDVQAVAATVNAVNEASQDVDARVTANAALIAAISAYTDGLKRGLHVKQSSTSPDTDVQILADALAMSDGTTVVTSVDVLADIGDSGAGGLDTGTVAADTWYYVFVIHDSGGTASPTETGLLSTSLVPTMPTGYDKYRRVGCVKTDGDSDIHPFMHVAGTTEYRLFASDTYSADPGYVDVQGGGWDAAWAEVDWSGEVPGAVDEVIVGGFLQDSATNTMYIRPYGSAAAVGRCGQVVVSTAGTGWGATPMILNTDGKFELYLSNASTTASVNLAGWYDDA